MMRLPLRSRCALLPLLATSLLAAPACKRDAPSGPKTEPVDPSKFVFHDVAAAAGIRSVHHKPILDHQLDPIMSWMASVGAAAAAGDYNNDGWIDLYVTDSLQGMPNHLYRNNGDGTFTDLAKQAGLADLNDDRGVSMDCIFGDYDNDGWADLYLARWGYDALFRNNGDGTFTEVTDRLFKKRDGSPGTQWANGNGAIFLDYDLDGRLDIYVGNYFDEVDLWRLKSTRVMHDDFERARNGGKNYLYHQLPDGTFAEVAESLGLDDSGWTLAVGSADVNNDGSPDIYCADDFGPDQLFLNRGDGTFANVSDTAIGFDSKKGMNVDFGDFDNDGWQDIYVTNITTSEYLQEGNMLWHNNGPDADGKLTFTDVSLETGTYDGGWGWGAKFLDYDNDGDLDIISLNGFISAGEGNYWYDLATWTVTGQNSADARNWPAIGDRSFSGYEQTRLFQNDGFTRFTERAGALGLVDKRDGRGAVVFDYDNDGDLDLFIANQDRPPCLYRNDGSFGRRWLTVALEGDPATKTNRDAVGARVTIVTSQGMQIRERDGGNGFSAQSDPRVHFGLGDEDRIKLLEIRWPDGGLQYVEDVPTNRSVKVRQDPSSYAERVAVKVGRPKAWAGASRDADRKRPAIDPAEADRILSEMEGHLREGLTGFAPASSYRARAVAYERHDRAVSFFSELVSASPEDARARIELACAYVDKIPTCGGIAAVVSKGSLAKKALDQLDAVIARDPTSWPALYCRGMDHLHWPRALLHSEDAAADFVRCIERQRAESPDKPRDYYVRTHIGLGDAYTKAKRYADARAAWKGGLKLFPDSEALRERLAISDDGALLTFVEKNRSLEQPIDTSLSFLDRAP